MVRHGGFICRRIGSYFCYFGSILVPSLPFWFHFGSIPSILVPFWFYFGSIVVPCWFHVGSILFPIWFHFGSKVLVPRSWYPPKAESLRGGASQKSARGRGGLQAPRQGHPPVKTILWTQSQDFGTRIYREPIVNLIIVHLS